MEKKIITLIRIRFTLASTQEGKFELLETKVEERRSSYLNLEEVGKKTIKKSEINKPVSPYLDSSDGFYYVCYCYKEGVETVKKAILLRVKELILQKRKNIDLLQHNFNQIEL